jgi:FKBP-type peptidyl-prolyl cis-trans isomerase
MRAPVLLASLLVAFGCATPVPPDLPVFPIPRVAGDTLALAGGLRAIVVHPGEGEAARAGSRVRIHYTGWLEDDRVFDNSRSGEPIVFRLGDREVIRGWELGITGMRPGERRRLLVPPELGYGARGHGPVPPNAPLVFDVELLEILR